MAVTYWSAVPRQFSGATWTHSVKSNKEKIVCLLVQVLSTIQD